MIKIGDILETSNGFKIKVGWFHGGVVGAVNLITNGLVLFNADEGNIYDLKHHAKGHTVLLPTDPPPFDWSIIPKCFGVKAIVKAALCDNWVFCKEVPSINQQTGCWDFHGDRWQIEKSNAPKELRDWKGRWQDSMILPPANPPKTCGNCGHWGYGNPTGMVNACGGKESLCHGFLTQTDHCCGIWNPIPIPQAPKSPKPHKACGTCRHYEPLGLTNGTCPLCDVGKQQRGLREDPCGKWEGRHCCTCGHWQMECVGGKGPEGKCLNSPKIGGAHGGALGSNPACGAWVAVQHVKENMQTGDKRCSTCGHYLGSEVCAIAWSRWLPGIGCERWCSFDEKKQRMMKRQKLCGACRFYHGVANGPNAVGICDNTEVYTNGVHEAYGCSKWEAK